MLLGELLGDADPTGPVTPELREAIIQFRTTLGPKVSGALEQSCNLRTEPLGAFMGDERRAYCTALAGEVAAAVAGVLWDAGRASD
jgi:hypothetical protein